MRSTLDATNSTMEEAEEQISDLEDRVMEIKPTKREKKNYAK